jgi:hypothetical protein
MIPLEFLVFSAHIMAWQRYQKKGVNADNLSESAFCSRQKEQDAASHADR